jgi:hypothetical protein
MLRLIPVTDELVLKFGFVVVKYTENAIYRLTLAPLNKEELATISVEVHSQAEMIVVTAVITVTTVIEEEIARAVN